MMATGEPLAGIVLLLTATPIPTEYGDAMFIFFIVALGGAVWKSQEARIKRAESQVDTLTATMSEVLTVVKRLDDARSNPPRQG